MTPSRVVWLDGHHMCGRGQKALKIGCGLGDDAEELAQRGSDTTTFDILPTAVAWCQQRVPNLTVECVLRTPVRLLKSSRLASVLRTPNPQLPTTRPIQQAASGASPGRNLTIARLCWGPNPGSAFRKMSERGKTRRET